jgi:Na+/H+ antiporter NhaC/uncharacterized protein YneF (UPF0154 family)
MKAFFKLEDTPKDKEFAGELWADATELEYANDKVICSIGETADAMYFIESGKVEVVNSDNQVVNELEEGQFFGEYAVITGDKRISTVRSKGGTVLYRMNKEIVSKGLNNNSTIYGDLIKKLYMQIGRKHSELMLLTSQRRGIAKSIKSQKKGGLALFIHYFIILMIFFAAAYFPNPENPNPVWVLLPIVFLVVNISVTKRTLESLVFACLLGLITLYRSGFLFGFYDELLETISYQDTMDIALILILLGAFTRLLACSGGINALRRIITKRIKTQRSSLLMSLFFIIIIFIEDYLSMLISSICFMPVNDQKRVPREMSTFVMGMTPEAINTLVPISVWGIFLTGLITLSTGENGAALFWQSIPFNFAAILTLLLAFLAAIGKLPLVGTLKKAHKRVEDGGSLWPPNSEQYFMENDNSTWGNVLNLFLPILILVVSSVFSTTVIKGEFSVNIGYGLIITLLFMFVFYCFQKLMTPEEFFDNIVAGAESMLVPVILLAVTLLFSESIAQLGLINWLTDIMFAFGLSNWLLPFVLFFLFTIVCMLLGSSWAMYAIGLPIAIQLAAALDANLALCIGAICAAGVSGDGLSYYQSDNLFTATVIGCELTAMVSARIPYYIFMTVLSCVLYLVAGIML